MAHIGNSSPSAAFPLAEFIWKYKIPSQVKAFAWTVVVNRVNTNDLLQIRWPHKALSPNVCVLCFKDAETHIHLFLHCPVAREMWSRLLAYSGEHWVVPQQVDNFLIWECWALARLETTQGYGIVHFSLCFGVCG